MKLITGFFMAWGNFCAIPCPWKLWDEKARDLMLVMFPLVGVVIGMIWQGMYWIFYYLEMPIPLFAALMTAYPFLVSGFIHLDGFMDCNDAILSRRSLAERQRILKDSHVGAFAVITTIVLFMVFFGAMWSLLEMESSLRIWCLSMVPVLSRAMSARAAMVKKPLSTSQYQRSFEEGTAYRGVPCFIWLAAAMVMVVEGVLLEGGLAMDGKTMLLCGLTPAVTAVCQLAASLISGAYARKQLGGMSGDIAGYMLVWSELAAVVSLLMVF